MPRSLLPRTVVLLGLCVGALAGSGPAHARMDEPPAPVRTGWVWPLASFRLESPYAAPTHAYGPGHRGADLRGAPQAPVRAPAPGVIAFAGTVVDRGVLTIDHGDGLVTTLEPVTSDLPPGSSVRGGQDVGMLGLGGHTAAGALHFGVRWNGEYVNPLLLLGRVPRAVLLPCC